MYLFLIKGLSLENIENIDRHKTLNFGASKCYWIGDFWLKL